MTTENPVSLNIEAKTEDVNNKDVKNENKIEIRNKSILNYHITERNGSCKCYENNSNFN